MLRYQPLVEKAYAAFNARDIDTTLSVMHAQVHWPKAFEGGFVIGQSEVRKYWQRQWSEISPTVTPIGFRERADGRLEVEVAQLVKDLSGNVLFDGIVLHVYTIADDLLMKMEIES